MQPVYFVQTDPGEEHWKKYEMHYFDPLTYFSLFLLSLQDKFHYKSVLLARSQFLSYAQRGVLHNMGGCFPGVKCLLSVKLLCCRWIWKVEGLACCLHVR